MDNEQLVMSNGGCFKSGRGNNKAAIRNRAFRFLFLGFLFILFSCGLLSCHNPFEPQRMEIIDAGKGVLALAIGVHGTERTILPHTMFSDFVKFDLQFIAKDAKNNDFNITWTDDSGTVALDLGTWDLVISAYLDDGDGGYIEAAKGRLDGIIVPSGKTIAGNVMLHPVTVGQGKFSYSINFPENVTSASMEIIRLDEDAEPYQEIFYFTGVTTVGKNGSMVLNAGQYRVIFKLSNGKEEASLSEILHVYHNMESVFTEVFTDRHFPATVFNLIIAAWNDNLKIWDFAGAGITAVYLSYMGLEGINDSNFNAITVQFNTLCATGATPNNYNELMTLADTALIGIAAADSDFFNAAHYMNQSEAEAAIIVIAANRTALQFDWDTNGQTLTVAAGNYACAIIFSAPVVPVTPGLAFSLIDYGTAYAVSAGTAFAEHIVIPAVYNGRRVTAIVSNGFYNSNLISIAIPSSVTSIGAGAFYDCSSLTSVTIPSSVTSIDYSAFSGCSSLTSIAIPDSVISIGDYAFWGCTLLTSIAIPDSVTSIGGWLFDGCSNLESITVESGNTVYRSEGNCLIKISNNELIAGCKNSVIPSSVTSIGSRAFAGCSSLTSITIPSSVTSIDSCAFAGCSSLTSVTIPSGVTSIEYYAFQGCSSLTSIAIPDSVTSIVSYAFYGCSSLTSITIPDSVTSIGSCAFLECSSLTSVTIPSGVTSLLSGTFAGCSLTTVYYGGPDITAWNEIMISDSDSRLTKAFRYYYSETDPGTSNTHWRFAYGAPAVWNYSQLPTPGLSFALIDDGTAYSVTNGTATASHVIIPAVHEGLPVKTIGNSGFSSYSNLFSISIPEGVASIGSDAFYYCSSLTSIAIPSSVTSIGARAFYGCSMTSIAIPSGVTSIGAGAFSGCSSLTSIAIPSGVTSIGAGAFSGCSSLTSIAIPSGVTSIDSSAFYGCSSLASIAIPSGVTSIGSSAFYYCRSLTSITIPSGVTSIDIGAFSDCSSLESIAVESGNTAYRSEGNCLIKISNNELIAGCKNSTIPSSVTSIGSSAFYGCSSLTSIVIPSSVTSIGSSAFIRCRSLESITVESCNTVYRSEGNCLIRTATNEPIVGCKNIVIPSSVTSIGSQAFIYWSSLTSIVIPSSVTSIGDSAFYGCASLTSIVIPSSVTSIGSSAFEMCHSLTTVYYGGPDIAAWNEIMMSGVYGHYYLTNASRYYYSETDPGTSNTHWRFANGVPTVWIDNQLPTPGLSFTLIDSGTAYSVAKGTATAPHVTIPAVYEGLPVKAIGGSGFSSYSNLFSIAIPSSVTSIGEYAFSGCSSLTSIAIPSSVTSIGEYACLGCSSLESITVESGNTVYRSEGNCLIKISNNELIAGCKNSVIPSSVTSIGSGAFRRCSLASIAIPSGVTSIGSYAFSGCSSLRTVYYGGADIAAWNSITISSGNEPLSSVTVYYYSETYPETRNTHWRWVGGVPTVWK